MKLSGLASFFIFCVCHVAFGASIAVDHTTLQKLATMKAGEQTSIQVFPIGGSETGAIRLAPARVYADAAHIYEMSAAGKREVPRSRRVFLRGHSDDGRTSVGITLETDGTFVEGNGNGPGGAFVLSAVTDRAGSITLTAKAAQAALPEGFKFDFKCNDESMTLTPPPGSIQQQLHDATSPGAGAVPAASGMRYAIVAIDTDSLLLSRMFGNNTTTATNYIASLFNSMNTMYESDLQVQLLIGTTILRTNPANDPYSNFSQTTSADTTKLNEFSSYWQSNESGVTRAFAALLSGVTASTNNSCSASGIASIDAYCDTSRSYSVNQLCTSIGIDPNGTVLNSRIVGHEIGHNFGAWHTHCTNATSGAAPVSSPTIDQCYNGESGLGCYGGTTSCPAGGSGTIMSYCNTGACGAVQNQLHFHPTQINKVLLPDIASNTPSCLSTVADEIFKNGFEP